MRMNASALSRCLATPTSNPSPQGGGEHQPGAAHLWCENTTRLTGKPWAYVKVLQTAYKQLQPTRFEDLLVLGQKTLL
jgi:hypothetical protein